MIPSLVRAVTVLETIGSAVRPPSLSQLTRQLDIPKSTLHDICVTLVHERLLTHHEGTYRLGTRLLDLYRAQYSGMQITTEFLSVCQDQMPQHEETVILSVLDGTDTVCLACRQGSHAIGVSYRVGLRLPANCTASGKTILSTLPEVEVRELFPRDTLVRLTKRSLARTNDLLAELSETRTRGYAIDDEQTSDGMYCLGAPVFAQGEKRAVAAIAFGFLKARLDDMRIEKLTQEVRILSRILSERLGADDISYR